MIFDRNQKVDKYSSQHLAFNGNVTNYDYDVGKYLSIYVQVCGTTDQFYLKIRHWSKIFENNFCISLEIKMSIH